MSGVVVDQHFMGFRAQHPSSKLKILLTYFLLVLT